MNSKFRQSGYSLWTLQESATTFTEFLTISGKMSLYNEESEEFSRNSHGIGNKEESLKETSEAGVV